MAKGKYEKWLEPDSLLRIEAWVCDGLTDEQIAQNMGIAYSTLRVWRDKYSALSAALKKGKDVADIKAENALYKRALGYISEDIKETYNADGKLTSRVITKKTVPPDVTACIIWLKNRRPDKWGDKPVDKTENSEQQSIVFEIVAASEVRKNAEE